MLKGDPSEGSGAGVGSGDTGLAAHVRGLTPRRGWLLRVTVHRFTYVCALIGTGKLGFVDAASGPAPSTRTSQCTLHSPKVA